MRHSASSPGFAHVVREHAEALAHAGSNALAACAALQQASGQLRAAVDGGVAALGAWLLGGGAQAPAEEASWLALAEATRQLGVHLTALQAEAAELTKRSRRLAVAQGDVSAEAHRWVRALVPDACLEGVEGGATLQEPLLAPHDAVRELCKRHPQAFVRSDLEAAFKRSFAGAYEPLRLPALEDACGTSTSSRRPAKSDPGDGDEASMEMMRPGNVRWGSHRGSRRARCAVSLTGRRCVSESPGASAGSQRAGGGGDGSAAATPELRAESKASEADRATAKPRPNRSGVCDRSMQQTRTRTWDRTIGSSTRLSIETHQRSPVPDEISRELQNTSAQLAATRAELTSTKSELTLLKAINCSGTMGDTMPAVDPDSTVLGTKILPPPHKLEDEVRRLKEQLKETETEHSKMREQLAEAQVELAVLHSRPQDEDRESSGAPLLVKKIAKPNGGGKTEAGRLKDRLAETESELTKARQELFRSQEQLSDSQRRLSQCLRELEASRGRPLDKSASNRRERESRDLPRHVEEASEASRRKSTDRQMDLPKLTIKAVEQQPAASGNSLLDIRSVKPSDSGASLHACEPCGSARKLSAREPSARSAAAKAPASKLAGAKATALAVPKRRPPGADVKPAKPRAPASVRSLWAKAAEYAYRLVEVGRGFHVHYTHHRCTAVGITDICRRFGTLFEGFEVGIYEFISQHARSEEFNFQVRDLVGGEASATLRRVRSTSPVDLSSMEETMKLAYDSAFKAVGGQVVAEARFPTANKLMRELMRARGHCRARQDVGFEIMGLDMLYTTVREHNLKLVREVKRIAERTRGTAKCPSLKGRPRARAKVLTKYGNDVACLTDVMRASIVYEGIDELYDALLWICEEDLKSCRRDFFVLEVNDRFQKCKDGYRDIAMLVDVDGVIGEVQLHVKAILSAKSTEGHDVYKQQRLINESLFEACVRNAEADVASLAREYQVCARGVRDKNGRNALHYSCQTGSLQTTRLLLRYSADPWVVDDLGVLACELALKHGHFDVTELMLAKMRLQAPTTAAAPRRLVGHVTRWWCDHVAHEPEDALNDRWFDIGRSLIQVAEDCGAMRPLNEWFLEAASKGRLWRVRTMLKAGFDVTPTADQPSALDLAIENGQEEMAMLLSSYQDPEHHEHGLQCARCRSATVHAHLRKAAEQEDVLRAASALTAKADPDHITAKAHGNRTALMAFSAAGNLELVQRLVRCRAQVGWYDKFGCSAVHYARMFGNSKVEAFLESEKSMPYLGSIPEGKLPTTYLPDAVREGCCAPVWRYVTAMGGHGETGREEALAEIAAQLSQPLEPYNETLLHLAVQAAVDNRDPSGQVCRALLLYRADAMAQTSKRDLPLHYAAGAGLNDLYSLLLQAMAQAAGGDARAYERSLSNDWGQTPKEMLENSLICQGLRRDQAAAQEADVLLRVGFFAFQQQGMLSRLRLWRDDQAVHLFEVLHNRWSFFAGSRSLDKFESESSCEESMGQSGAESGPDDSMSPCRSTARSRIRKRASAKSSPVKQDPSRSSWQNPSLKQVHFAVKMKRLRQQASLGETSGKGDDAGGAS